MIRRAARVRVLCGLTVALWNVAQAADAPGDFSGGTLDGWEERSFKGHTRYRLLELDDATVLEASAESAASVLYRRDKVDITAAPLFHWQWRVENLYAIENERIKAGDDFPARAYVVAKTGPLPWQTLALNYVWASTAPAGSDWPNPFTDKAHMIVLQSGPTRAGEWVSERRDVRADFERYFGRDVTEIVGYAVMVDGDNSGSSGRAWFGDIGFESR